MGMTAPETLPGIVPAIRSYIEVLKKRAELYELVGLYKECLEDIETAAGIAGRPSSGCSDLVNALILKKAGYLGNRTEFGTAKKIVKALLKKRNARADPELCSTCLVFLGNIERNTGGCREALFYYRRAASLNRRARLKPDIGLLCNMGLSYQTLGEFGKAAAYFKEFIREARKRDDIKSQAMGYSNLSVLEIKRGDLENARDHIMLTLRIYEKVGNKRGIALCYNSLGMIYRNKGRYSAALKCYGHFLSISEEIGLTKAIGDANNNIGIVYYFKGNNAKALEHYGKALKVDKMLKNRNGMAEVNLNMASIYLNKGEYRKALECSSFAERTFRNVPNSYGTVLCLLNRADIEKKLGCPEKALEVLEKAEKLALKYNFGPQLQSIRKEISGILKPRPEN